VTENLADCEHDDGDHSDEADGPCPDDAARGRRASPAVPGIWACGWMRSLISGLASWGKVDGRRARFDTALLQRQRSVQRPRYRRGTGGPAGRSSDPIDVLTVPSRASTRATARVRESWWSASSCRTRATVT